MAVVEGGNRLYRTELASNVRLNTAYLVKMIMWEYSQSMRPKFGQWKHVHGNFLSHKLIKISSVCVHNLLVPWQTCCVQLCALWAWTETIHEISTFSTDCLCCLLDSNSLDMLNSHSMILSSCITCIHSQPGPPPCCKPKTVSHKYTNHYFSTALLPSSHPVFCQHCKWWKAK